MNKTVGLITMEKVENRMMNTVASSRIRCNWLLPYWEEAEEYRIGAKYEAVIFQKAYYKMFLKEFKGIKIFDICDPDWLEPRAVFESIDYVQGVTTSSEALTDYIKKIVNDKPVITIPDRINFNEVKKVKEKHEGKAKSVVWFGYSYNLKYIERTFDYLASKGLSLTIISDELLALPRNNLDIRFIKYRYELINEEVVKHDFVIMPSPSITLDIDGKLQFKSNNKIVQSWAWGMPVATTPIEIDRFLSGEERQKEVEQRLIEVKRDYDCKLSVIQYKKLIEYIRKYEKS